MTQQYYTISEVAEILRCSEKTVYNRVKSGKLRSIKNGRLVLFTKESIDEFLGIKPQPQSIT